MLEEDELGNGTLPINSLVVIGNGFDLAAGLESRYYNFLVGTGVIKNGQLWNDHGNIWYVLLYTYYCDANCTSFRTAPANMSGLKWLDIEWFIRHVIAGETNSDIYRKLVSIKKLGYVSEYDDVFPNIRKIGDLLSESSGELDAFLERSLADLEEELRKYLQGEVESNQEYGYNCSVLLDAILDKDVELQKTCVLSFNYTTPDLGVARHISVHGDLKNGGIIIGIDEHSALGEKEEIRKRATPFTKSFKKMSRNENLTVASLPSGVETIYFYGLSLSEQDLAYYRSIFNYYDVYNKTVRLVFCYPKKYLNDPTPEAVIRNNMVTSVHRLLSDYVKGINKIADEGSFITRLLLEGRLILKPIDDVNSLRNARSRCTYASPFLDICEPLYLINRPAPFYIDGDYSPKEYSDDQYMSLPLKSFGRLISLAISQSHNVLPEMNDLPIIEDDGQSWLYTDKHGERYRVINFANLLIASDSCSQIRDHSTKKTFYSTVMGEWDRLEIKKSEYSDFSASLFGKTFLDVLRNAKLNESLILFVPFSLGHDSFARNADQVELLYGVAHFYHLDQTRLFFLFVNDDSVVLCGPTPEKRESFSTASLSHVQHEAEQGIHEE